MNTFIYKYSLNVSPFVIELTTDFKVICVHEQNNKPTIWIEVNPDNEKISVQWFIVPTGSIIPKMSIHVGTCFIGPNVWHIYRRKLTKE